MKNIFLVCLLLIMTTNSAQIKMLTKTGKIVFEASIPSFEEVKAKNEGVTCVLNIKTGEIAILAQIKEFRFKVALMEEHFNQNYINSDRYPKAIFKGKLENFKKSDLSSKERDYYIKGKLELHGKTQKKDILAKIRNKNDGIEIVSNFTINSEDFNIYIPPIVKNKVSNIVNVRTELFIK